MNTMVLEHFAMIGYILMVKPFDNRIDNWQVLISEVISLSSTLHMFVFSDFYSFEPNGPNIVNGPPLRI